MLMESFNEAAWWAFGNCDWSSVGYGFSIFKPCVACAEVV